MYLSELKPPRSYIGHVTRRRTFGKWRGVDSDRAHLTGGRPPTPSPSSTDGAPRLKGVPRFVQSAWDFFWLYMEMSSIHGFSHLTSRNRSLFEYLLWLIFMILGLTGAVSIGRETWRRYQENPTVLAMDRDANEFNTSSPTATICPSTKILDDALQEKVRGYSGKDPEDYERFLKAIFSASYTSFEMFNAVKNNYDDVLPPSKYMRYVYENRFNFEYSIIYSIEGPLPDVWTLYTEHGICYSYNTDVAFVNNPDVWNGNREINHSLLIQGNELSGDMFSQMMDMNSPSKVYMTDPAELPDIATRSGDLPDQAYMTYDMTALAIFSDPQVRSLSINQRRCRFPEESNLVLSSQYSYNLCRMECRMKHAYSLCECVPYFYKDIGYKICDVAGMRCLAKYEEALVRLLDPKTNERLKCHCLPLCENTNFITEMISHMPWFLGTNLKFSISKFPPMRIKRDILFGFTDVLVSIGGTAGLFLGCSILSFIEIIYYFTLRLFWYVCQCKKKK